MKTKRGITLLELLIVLGILVIVGGAAVAGVRAQQRRTLNNASLTLQAHMRRLQQLAVLEGRNYRIIFNMEDNSYLMRHQSWGSPSETVYLPQGVTIRHISHPHNTTVLEFLPRGTPSAGMTVELQHGPFIQTLTVVPSGGRVYVNPVERLS